MVTKNHNQSHETRPREGVQIGNRVVEGRELERYSRALLRASHFLRTDPRIAERPYRLMLMRAERDLIEAWWLFEDLLDEMEAEALEPLAGDDMPGAER